MTIEPNNRQVAGNAESILEIQVKSEIGGVAALDNVARFSLLSVVSGQWSVAKRGRREPRVSYRCFRAWTEGFWGIAGLYDAAPFVAKPISNVAAWQFFRGRSTRENEPLAMNLRPGWGDGRVDHPRVPVPWCPDYSGAHQGQRAPGYEPAPRLVRGRCGTWTGAMVAGIRARRTRGESDAEFVSGLFFSF